MTGLGVEGTIGVPIIVINAINSALKPLNVDPIDGLAMCEKI